MARRAFAARWAAALVAGAVLSGSPSPGAVVAGALVVRSSGRSPVVDGRGDSAFQRALDAAFRSAVLEALRTVAPDRQSPRDLETWQETVLPRAADFVGAWRILGQREQSGFLEIDAEVEIWEAKLARAARTSPGAAAAAPAVRLVVLAEPLPLADPSADEEIDAGAAAAAALEAELARRGAVIVAPTSRAPWRDGRGVASEENRAGVAAAEGRRLEADAVLILQLSRRGDRLSLAAQLIGTASESTLASSRAEVPPAGDGPLGDALAQAARQLAATVGRALPAARPSHAPAAHP